MIQSARCQKKIVGIFWKLDKSWSNQFNKVQKIEVPKILLKDLTDASLTAVLEQQVQLQNEWVFWKDLLKVEDVAEISLANLINAKSVAGNVLVSKDFQKGLYVSRKFVYKNSLKHEVLKECSGSEFVYSKDAFESKLQSNPAKNIHWLERSGETLNWMKTSRDISGILKLIEDGKPAGSREESMVDLPQRISILIDIAGMGKSTVLNCLAQQIKKKNPNYFVIKIDLNDYSNQLDELDSEDLETCEKAVGLLAEKIMNLQSGFEKNLFWKSCMESGNVILLFDGFDEVAGYYKEQVTKLMKTLLQTSIKKIFIASRPEWSEYLEREFLQIKHSLMAFAKEDQEKYLIDFIKDKLENTDEDKLKRITETILSLLTASLSDEEFQFTGVPLIMKLVADFFESRICEYFQGPAKDFEEWEGCFVGNIIEEQKAGLRKKNNPD